MLNHFMYRFMFYCYLFKTYIKSNSSFKNRFRILSYTKLKTSENIFEKNHAPRLKNAKSRQKINGF